MKDATKKLAMEDSKAEADAKLAQQPADEQTKLMDELATAHLHQDWKLLAVKAKALADYQTKLDALELDAKQSKLIGIADKLKLTIDKLVSDMLDDVAIEMMDGVWYEHSWVDASSSIRLLAKQATQRKASTTGYGKKFVETTESLLEAHGHEEYKDGLTFKEAWDAKADKNSRYGVRKKLTEKYGTPTS